MRDLKVTIIQLDLVWENPEENLINLNQKIEQISEKQELVVLPEMFNTGFSINPEKCAENIDGSTVNWLKNKAKEKDCVFTGSLIISENNHFYNRLIWMNPDGSFFTYDKRHLFRMSDEFKLFSAGSERLIVELKGWKIMPLVCYDLRFPVWSKNRFSNNKYEYDLLICMANWPEARSLIWKTLLHARAIENQVYVIGVNRIGVDGLGISFSGDSSIIDPNGELIHRVKPFEESVKSVIISYDELALIRKDFTVGLDWDDFCIKIKKHN